MYMHPLRKAACDKLDSAISHIHSHYGHLPEHRDRISSYDYPAVLILYAMKEKVYDCPMVELLPYREGLEA